MSRWTCVCTTAAADRCADDATFNDRWPDGSCGCSCHIEYSEDPSNWQPISTDRRMSDAEFAAIDDWLERIEDAEALTDG